MKKALGKAVLAVLIFLGLNVFLSIPIGIIAGVLAAVEGIEVLTAETITELIMTNTLLKTVSFILSSAAGVAAAVILYYAMEKDRAWTLGFSRRMWLAKSLLGLALGALLITLAFLLVHAFGGVRVTEAAWSPELAAALCFDALVFLAVGIGEETLSRGYVYGVIKRSGGIAAAVAVSSLLFALLHANNSGVFSGVFPMLNLTLAGVMLALLREWSGSLWAPIGAHITWNFFQGNVFGMAVSGVKTASVLQVEKLNEFAAGGSFGLEGSFAATIVLVLVSAWLALAIRKRTIQSA